jgi:hypothetical protein
MGLGEGSVGCRCIADGPIATEIARHVLIELRRTRRHRHDYTSDRRQDAIFDADALGSVSGGLDAVADDHRHRIANVAHFAPRQ